MEKVYIGTRPIREIDPATASPTATATASPTSGDRIVVTDIAGSSEIVGAKIRVIEGTTTIWEIQIPAQSATPYGIAVSFNTPLVGAKDTKMYVEVDGITSTPAAYACLVGFSAKN